MISLPFLSDICQATSSKIVMLVVDGLGGVAHPETRKSELETADLPNLDRLAQKSACGLTVPVFPGITPGSAPGHLALFGYDPVKYFIGRGVLEALGIGVELERGDVAARGNFCTVDGAGLLVDRRAGRVSTKESTPLCEALDKIRVSGAIIRVYPVRDHRFVLVLRGEGLSDQVSETDPQRTGVSPLEVKALSADGAKTAQVANEFLAEARSVLPRSSKANMALLRGFSCLPSLPFMGEAYRLNPAAIAAYPMYRGLSKVVGMRVIPGAANFEDELQTLKNHYEEHDFFYLHYKPADAAGEDGSFSAKVRALEELDRCVPEIVGLKPDVFVVAGDHSTPSVLAAHSWHPVPFMLHSKWTLGEGVGGFSERACAGGSLGAFPAQQAMLLALAHAGKLTKFGP